MICKLHQVLAVVSASAAACEVIVLEKTSISVRFIPIVCAVPLLYAHAAGLFEKFGLHVDLVSTPGWSGVKDLLVYDRIDAAHMLVPMPLACTAGIDGRPSELRICLLQNQN